MKAVFTFALLCVSSTSMAIGLAAFANDESDPPWIANGAKAPELSISEWSDGNQHSLREFKGKTVVLHFWGTWCGPCIATIPVWKQLEKKYGKDDVVFIGVHTAGANMDEIREFMKKHDWVHFTGVDRGKSIADSETFRRYGISAVNQIVVVNGAGVVAYNGQKPTQTDGPIAIAQQLKVKGPGDEATEEEAREGAIAIMTYMYGKEIEAASKSSSKR